MIKIYKLIDPINNSVKYVGKTTQDVYIRLLGHYQAIVCKRNCVEKNNWLLSLIKMGLSPKVEIIEEVSKDIASEREAYWIKHYNNISPLLNVLFNNNQVYLKLLSNIKSISIYEYNLEGVFIKEWTSIIKASTFYNLDSGNICSAASGKRKLAGNRMWRYIKYDKLSPYKRFVNKKVVFQYTLKGKYIREFISARDIPGVSHKIISKCCNGKLHTVHGFRYSFEKKEDLGPIIKKKRENKANV